MRASMK